ncbi:MAG: hypothetical protein ABIP89_01340, partial [Polyangiaceae bacterium]
AVPVAIFRVPPGNYAVQVIAGTLTQITPACAPIAGSRCFSPALGGTTGTLSTESYFAVGVPGIPCADEDYSFRFTPIP